MPDEIKKLLLTNMLAVAASLVLLRVLTGFMEAVEIGRLAIMAALGLGLAKCLLAPGVTYLQGRNAPIHVAWVRLGAYALALLVALAAIGVTIDRSYPALGIPLLDALLVAALLMVVCTCYDLPQQLFVPAFVAGAAAAAAATIVRPVAEFYLVAYGAGFLVAMLVQGALAFRRRTAVWGQGARPLTLAALIVLIGIAAADWTLFHAFRVLLGELGPLNWLGTVAVGFLIGAGIMGMYERVATTIIFPYFARHEGRLRGYVSVPQVYVEFMLPMTGLLALAVAVNSAPLVTIAADERLHGAKPYVELAAAMEACRIIANALTMGTGEKQRAIVGLAPKLGGAALAVALLLWLVPRYGASGFVASMMSSAGCYVLLTVLTAARVVGIVVRLRVTAELVVAVILLALVQLLLSGFDPGIVGSVLLLLVQLAVIAVAGMRYLATLRTFERP